MTAKLKDRARRIHDIVRQIDSLQAELDLLLTWGKQGKTVKVKSSAISLNGGGRRAKKTKLSKALMQWRKAEGLSLKEASAIFKVSDATFSHWEHGKNAPRGDNALRVQEMVRAHTS